MEEMFDVAAVLSAQPVPAGRRAAVLTNGGGPGILVADACEAAGLLVPELSDDTQAKLRAGLPPQASVKNPVDTVASATAEQYGQALRLLGTAEEIDAIIAVYIPAFVPAEDIARTITAAAAALPAKPVIAVFLTAGAAPASLADAGIAGHAAEFLVQEQIRDGVEMIVGVTHDPAFGPLVLAGLGGTMVEVLGDVAVRITPLSGTDVDEMLRSLRSCRLLTGYRQSPPLDVAAFAELLHRVSAMVEDIPEIAELDLNPVFARQHGAVVADVRLTG